MGIGLAQACGYYGLEFRCVVDPRTTAQNIRMLRAYGARIEMVDKPDPETGEFLPARLKRVRHLLNTIDGSYWPNQYANEGNPEAHRLTTLHEIATALDNQVDYLFCATSTCGMVRGCSDYVRAHGLKTKVYAVDAVGSVIFGGEKARRRIPGMGAGRRPELFRDDMMDGFLRVTDLDCVIGCRRLVQEEAVLVGGSAGGVVMAVDRMRHQITPGSNCVMILCDRGERYLDTIYSNEWVAEHFGESVFAHKPPLAA